MKRSRFRNELTIGIQKEHHAGHSTKELNRKHGNNDAGFYLGRSKFGGIEVSAAQRLKSPESENAKEKRMLAEQMLDVATLKELVGKDF